LHVTPFLLPLEEQRISPALPGFGQRKNFCTIGNFRHPPNADSVRYLYEEIWPDLRERCPEAAMNVYGADLTPALQSLHQPGKGFFIKGRAGHAVETLSSSRVCLAPLRFGAGLKGKLLDAMRAGTPSVTTPIGAEGMQGSASWPGAIESDPARFVAAATDLYQNEHSWKAARQQIKPLLSERFDRDLHGPALMERVHTLLEEPADASRDQLTGALLRHHQHRSNEYMSRWIEAKNASK